jgi:hypothetical protein
VEFLRHRDRKWVFVHGSQNGDFNSQLSSYDKDAASALLLSVS